MTDPTPRTEADFSDADKLRVLAAWFDMWDERDDVRRRSILDDQNFPGKNDVQRDLRRIADESAQARTEALDVERLAAAICNVEAVIQDKPGWGRFSEAGRDLFRKEAVRLAAEYARLSQPDTETGS